MLRIPEQDYENWTFRQFNNALTAFYEFEDSKERGEWERARWGTWMLHNLQLAKKDKQKITDILPLPWDEMHKKRPETKVDPATLEKWRKWDEQMQGIKTE